MKKRVIITTTINPPTPAVLAFDALPDWHVIVIGDLKTPSDYSLPRGRYVSPMEQAVYDPTLSELIGWNCTARRNLGFLFARELGAEVIATVDDDNYPLAGWGENLAVDREVTVPSYKNESPAFDPLAVTSAPALWHRGFPLELLQDRDYDESTETIVPAVQADLWLGDPDVDAVCRAVYRPYDLFLTAPYPLFTSPRPAPFNSQNTFVASSVLRDYFMFPGTGRMEDIYAAYHLSSLGHRVVFGAPSVRQDRNAHSLTSDLRQEARGYCEVLEIVERIVADREDAPVLDAIPRLSKLAFDRYREHFK